MAMEIGTGVAAGLVTEAVKRTHDDVTRDDEDTLSVAELLTEIRDTLQLAVHFFDGKDEVQGAENEVVVLDKVNGWRLRYKGRKHVQFLLPQAAVLNVTITGLGSFQYVPSVDWHNLDPMPEEDTSIMLDASSSQSQQAIFVVYYDAD